MKFIQVKNIFPITQVARFNLAVWQTVGKDSLYFIGREVTKVGEMGEPDTGILKLFEVSKDGALLREKTIWKPVFEGINLEDPRVLELSHENLVIGLTALVRTKNEQHEYIPFPAIIKIDSQRLWKEELPAFLMIDTFGAGKDVTPIDNNTYFFRPDSIEYYHKLLVFSLHNQTAQKLSELEFPTDIQWASWRIGTAVPPIWLTATEAIFIIHGIQLQMINGIQTYVYSIGKAKLTRNKDKFTVTVGKDPIITPDDFLDSNGNPLVQELHVDKKVVYSCGGVIHEDNPDVLSLYVNVGDRTTFEVELSISELKKDLF